MQVGIIGAGMAGCAAARRLVQGGAQVTVLEARDRPGGRIWTDRSLGCPIDLGAAWLHGAEANPLSARARSLEHLDSDVLNNLFFNPLGEPLTMELSRQVQEAGLDLAAQAMDLASRSPEPLSMAEAMGRVFLESGDPGPWRARVRSLPIADMTAFAARPDALSGPPLEGLDRFLPGGLDQMLDWRSCNLLLSTPVDRLTWTDSKVEAATSRGSFRFDRVILTLPLGVLQGERVQFDPPLPDWKKDAIRALGTEVLNKVALRFDQAVWPLEPDFLSLNQPDGETDVFFNGHKALGQPVLVGFVVGQRARAFESAGSEKTVECQLASLRRAFPGLGRPQAVLVSSWGSDPYSLGAYCLRPPGVEGEAHDLLARPVGPLGFAGEATSRAYPGTLLGAWLSGRREADRLVSP